MTELGPVTLDEISGKIMAKIETEHRPWGWFEKFNENIQCTVKLIHVKANRRLSLQYHNRRAEFWRVIKGPVQVQIGEKIISGNEGDTFNIPIKTNHRLIGLKNDATILEISYGTFDEKDIVRIQDDYGRTD